MTRQFGGYAGSDLVFGFQSSKRVHFGGGQAESPARWDRPTIRQSRKPTMCETLPGGSSWTHLRFHLSKRRRSLKSDAGRQAGDAVLVTGVRRIISLGNRALNMPVDSPIRYLG